MADSDDHHALSRHDTVVNEKRETAYASAGGALGEKEQVASGAVDSAAKKRKSWFRKEKAEEPPKPEVPVEDKPKDVSLMSLFRYAMIQNR